MKIIRIVWREIRNAFTSVFRNFSLSIGSISCTAITLTLVTIAILFSYNISSMTKDIEDTLTIVAFVESRANDEVISKVKSELEALDNVDPKSIEFNSSAEISQKMAEEYETINTILDVLDKEDNPIQATYVVKVKDVTRMSETADKIEKLEHITHVKYGESLVNKLISSFNVLRNACLIAVGALIIVTVLLISNTIKLTIFSRKNEISIMRLVGTSNSVIKMPFLFEGFILGLIGAVIPVLLTIYGYQFLYDFVGGKVFTNMFILVEPKLIIYKISIILLVVGGLVGMLSSIGAVRKYLKV